MDSMLQYKNPSLQPRSGQSPTNGQTIQWLCLIAKSKLHKDKIIKAQGHKVALKVSHPGTAYIIQLLSQILTLQGTYNYWLSIDGHGWVKSCNITYACYCMLHQWQPKVDYLTNTIVNIFFQVHNHAKFRTNSLLGTSSGHNWKRITQHWAMWYLGVPCQMLGVLIGPLNPTPLNDKTNQISLKIFM